MPCKAKSLLGLILFQVLICSSQGFKSRFTISGAVSHASRAIFEMAPGSYLGCGFATDTTGSLQKNALVIMGLDNNGAPTWNKRYINTKYPYYTNGFIQRCFYRQDSSIYYAGAVNGGIRTIGVFIKFNSQGDTIWQRYFHFTDSLEDVIPQMVTGSVDGGFLITGFYQHWSLNTRHCLILKTDKNGKELWRKRISKAAPDVMDGKAIIQDSATKKIVIVGMQYKAGNAHYDNVVIADSLGNKVYQGSFCTTGGNGYDLIKAPDGNYLMVGLQYYAVKVGHYSAMRAFCCKFDINKPNAPKWKVNGFDVLAKLNGFTAAVSLDPNKILLAGIVDTIQGVYGKVTQAPSHHMTRLTIVDTSGKITWNRYYDYKINDTTQDHIQGMRHIALCNDGSWIGAIDDVSMKPFFFVKYDQNGCDSTAAHCATLNLVGVKQFEEPLAGLSLYPVPADDRITIHCGSHAISQLRLYDLSGRLVRELEVSGASFDYDTSDLAPGVYLLHFYRGSHLAAASKLIIRR